MKPYLKMLFIALLVLLVAAQLYAQDSEAIQPGDEITGELTSRNPSAAYTFSGEEGEVYTLTLTSNDFDTYLVLMNADGDIVEENDDSGGLLNSKIGPLELQADDEYVIIVDSARHNANPAQVSTGSYTLSLNSGGTIAEDDNNGSSSSDLLPYNETVIHRISKTDERVEFQLRGEEGDTILITLLSNDLYPYMEIAPSDDPYEIIASGSSYYESVSSGLRIGPLDLPETGEYTLTITTYGEGGEFSLLVEQIELVDLEYGTSLDIEIDSEFEERYFRFEGAAGDALDIFVNSNGEIDTALSVIGPDGYVLITDDDSGRGFDPEINRLILDEDGIHYLYLENFDVTSGEIQLVFELSEIRSLDNGAVQIRLSGERSTDVLTFTGEAGENVRLNVRVLGISDASGDPYITVLQKGETIAYASASYVSRVSIEFTVPEDGLVHVTIEDYAYGRVSLEVSIERVPGV